MEPLTPNDPLWKVLGQARRVEVRPNFTQNVVRLARQTPQDRGWLARFKGWFQEHDGARTGVTWAAVAAAIAITAAFLGQPDSSSSPAVVITAPVPAQTNDAALAETETDFPLVPEFETEWKNLEQVGDLLAVHDTSLLTDSEINLLLY